MLSFRLFLQPGGGLRSWRYGVCVSTVSLQDPEIAFCKMISLLHCWVKTQRQWTRLEARSWFLFLYWAQQMLNWYEASPVKRNLSEVLGRFVHCAGLCQHTTDVAQVWNETLFFSLTRIWKRESNWIELLSDFLWYTPGGKKSFFKMVFQNFETCSFLCVSWLTVGHLNWRLRKRTVD